MVSLKWYAFVYAGLGAGEPKGGRRPTDTARPRTASQWPQQQGPAAAATEPQAIETGHISANGRHPFATRNPWPHHVGTTYYDAMTTH